MVRGLRILPFSDQFTVARTGSIGFLFDSYSSQVKSGSTQAARNISKIRELPQQVSIKAGFHSRGRLEAHSLEGRHYT